MIGPDELNCSWGKVADRLVAMSEGPEFRDDGIVGVGHSSAAHGFAGTDLPGPLVLQALDSIIADGTTPPGGLASARGLALAAFFFGWEVRAHEIQHAV